MIRKIILASLLTVGISHSAIAEERMWELNAADAIKSNLESYKGKAVTLRLSSGEEIGGTVAEVGTTAVHLSALTGKEFYDAVVPLQEVVALVVRTK